MVPAFPLLACEKRLTRPPKKKKDKQISVVCLERFGSRWRALLNSCQADRLLEVPFTLTTSCGHVQFF